jgi:hypothetical protein
MWFELDIPTNSVASSNLFMIKPLKVVVLFFGAKDFQQTTTTLPVVVLMTMYSSSPKVIILEKEPTLFNVLLLEEVLRPLSTIAFSVGPSINHVYVLSI